MSAFHDLKYLVEKYVPSRKDEHDREHELNVDQVELDHVDDNDESVINHVPIPVGELGESRSGSLNGSQS